MMRLPQADPGAWEQQFLRQDRSMIEAEGEFDAVHERRDPGDGAALVGGAGNPGSPGSFVARQPPSSRGPAGLAYSPCYVPSEGGG
eukprot:66746-Pyramimonas_sp.AAC.1